MTGVVDRSRTPATATPAFEDVLPPENVQDVRPLGGIESGRAGAIEPSIPTRRRADAVGELDGFDAGMRFTASDDLGGSRFFVRGEPRCEAWEGPLVFLGSDGCLCARPRHTHMDGDPRFGCCRRGVLSAWSDSPSARPSNGEGLVAIPTRPLAPAAASPGAAPSPPSISPVGGSCRASSWRRFNTSSRKSSMPPRLNVATVLWRSSTCVESSGMLSGVCADILSGGVACL